MADFFKTNNVEWIRAKYVSHSLRGLRRRFPTEKRHKRPFSYILVWYIGTYICRKDDHLFFSLFIALLCCYFLGARTRECIKPHSEREDPNKTKDPTYYDEEEGNKFTPLRIEQVSWNPSFEKPAEIIIKLDKYQSKTNKDGKYLDKLPIECQCGKSRFGKRCFCLVHLLKEYLTKDYNRMQRKYRKDPLIVNEDGKPVRYQQFNNFLHHCIQDIREMTGIPLVPHHYTPHSIRGGAATDLARLGRSCTAIDDFGRWRTDHWKKTYILMDFEDLARLENTTYTAIRNQIYTNGLHEGRHNMTVPK